MVNQAVQANGGPAPRSGAARKFDSDPNFQTPISMGRVIIEWQDEFSISRRDQALKNPDTIRTLIEKAKHESKTSPTLEAIIEGIIALKWEEK